MFRSILLTNIKPKNTLVYKLITKTNLHSTQVLYARARSNANPLHKTGNPVIDITRDELNIENWNYSINEMRDGFNPYEREMVRKAIIVKSYLIKVQSELPALLNTFNPEPYSPPLLSYYLRFKFVDHLDDPANPAQSQVYLFIQLNELVACEKLNEPQIHSLKLILGKRFNPITNRIHFMSDRFPFRAQNKRWLIDTFINLLNQVKLNETDFSAIKVKASHVRRLAKKIERRNRLEFPRHWLNAGTPPLAPTLDLVKTAQSGPPVTEMVNPAPHAAPAAQPINEV